MFKILTIMFMMLSSACATNPALRKAADAHTWDDQLSIEGLMLRNANVPDGFTRSDANDYPGLAETYCKAPYLNFDNACVVITLSQKRVLSAHFLSVFKTSKSAAKFLRDEEVRLSKKFKTDPTFPFNGSDENGGYTAWSFLTEKEWLKAAQHSGPPQNIGVSEHFAKVSVIYLVQTFKAETSDKSEAFYTIDTSYYTPEMLELMKKPDLP